MKEKRCIACSSRFTPEYEDDILCPQCEGDVYYSDENDEFYWGDDE